MLPPEKSPHPFPVEPARAPFRRDRSTRIRAFSLLAIIIIAINSLSGLQSYISTGCYRGVTFFDSELKKDQEIEKCNTHALFGLERWWNKSRGNVSHTGRENVEDTKNDTSEPGLLDYIPQYVLEYAPLVHLFAGEEFWPCDMAEHLNHVTPEINYAPIMRSEILNLTNLNDLNQYDHGRYVYLTSNDNVEDRPDWLGGAKNIPVIPDEDETLQQPVRGGRSDAPAILVVVEKGDGVVDAFWFFFYSYNLGNKVFGIRFGNHVGDWEHTLVRFQDGKPQYVFVSEHFFGEAYDYDVVEKVGKRVSIHSSSGALSIMTNEFVKPVVYSAEGSHAMYATPGIHRYILPFGLLSDQTDRGPLWDPVLNSHTYNYDFLSDVLRPSNMTPTSPVEWFHFAGHWGDKHYPLSDSRQYQFVGEYHYVTGPLGPKAKRLGRRNVCQGRYEDPCVIRHSLGGNSIKFWRGPGNGED